MEFNDFFPQFNRPEYPKNPEAFQSALAWSLIDSEPRINEELTGGPRGSKKPIGLIYKKTSSRAKTISLVETHPGKKDVRGFSDALAAAGLAPDSSVDFDFVSETLLRALEGVRPARAKGTAAAPITQAAAFLQDPVGVHTKANPPNFAKIIEQIYGAGRPVGSDPCSAAINWHTAISSNEEGLEGVIDRGLTEYLRSGPIQIDLPVAAYKGASLAVEQPSWIREIDTPFRWFYDTWTAFCHPAWRRALAGRRWADWGSCILRTAISLAFLWESRFYRELGKLLISSSIAEEDPLKKLLLNPGPLLNWHDPKLRLTVRDQNSAIRSLISDGYSVRTALHNQLQGCEIPGKDERSIGYWTSLEGFNSFIQSLHRALGSEGRRAIENSFRQTSSGANNTIETVQYSLGIRQESGRNADFYGLLARRSRRFLVVEPAEEWIVVVASMCAKEPGGSTVLRSVRKSLASLGVGVSREILVAELERAGLTLSSHDADDAIEIWAGF